MMHLRTSHIRTLLFVAFVSAGSIACSKKIEVESSTPSQPPSAYCSPTSVVVPSPKTLTITPKYQYRVNGNGAIADRAIRNAEVLILDSSGSVVQCLETSSVTGVFTVDLPLNTGSYTIKINSRANNSSVKAYVLTDPWNNSHYSISGSFDSATAAPTAFTMTAAAASSGSVLGGAFNILDQILNANAYLRTKTAAGAAGCTPFGAECSTFTVAPVIYAYWKKGFNPNTYLGKSATNGVSFFLRGTNELYILGGINGDVLTSDTDHFDNTIILHEYGHFIEDTYSISDSQGGVHQGNTVIDPRLAWSEAFANFFQAAVLNTPVYLDTLGNIECGASPCFQDYINENLESYDSADNPGTVDPGEGTFREFSLTRALWDTIDAAVDIGETAQSPFSEIWTLMTSTNVGFKNSSLNFRNAGLFFKLQSALPGSTTNWATIRTNEDQRNDQRDYATPVTVPGVCGVNTIDPLIWRDGSYDDSDLFNDNDLYQYNHPGGTFRARIVYTVSGGDPTNLDLIIWKNGYRWGRTADIVAISAAEQVSDGGDEEVNLTLPAGRYMINVMGDSSALFMGSTPDASTYDLYIGSALQKACPNPGG